MQTLWNAKFCNRPSLYGDEPNQFIKEQLERLLTCKSVLCLAEGQGRNAIYLADKGLEVEALDISDVALMRLREQAKAHYVDITLRHTSLEQWEPSKHYGAVICTYLHLPKALQALLFQKAIRALAPEGWFMAELFSESQVNFHSGGPNNVGLLYDINDISDTLKSLPCHVAKLSQEVVVLQEGLAHVGRASVIRLLVQKQLA